MDAARGEIHLFSYLACLLSLYEGKPAAEWGYSFAVTDSGYPFSGDIQDCLQFMTTSGLLHPRDEYAGEYFNVSTSGKQEQNNLSQLSEFAEREPFLAGACSSLLALPIGSIRIALKNDLGIKGALALKQARLLLTETTLDLLYEQLGALSNSIGVNTKDLMVPAVVWLTYLSDDDSK
jgi:hypothetical protein